MFGLLSTPWEKAFRSDLRDFLFGCLCLSESSQDQEATSITGRDAEGPGTWPKFLPSSKVAHARPRVGGARGTLVRSSRG